MSQSDSERGIQKPSTLNWKRFASNLLENKQEKRGASRRGQVKSSFLLQKLESVRCEHNFLYLIINPAGVHPSGEGLDGDDSLPHSEIGPSISHHTILLLTDEGGSSETQEFSISEREKT